MHFLLNGDLFERPDREAAPLSTDYGCSNEHSVMSSNCVIRSMPSRHYEPRWSEAVFAGESRHSRCPRYNGVDSDLPWGDLLCFCAVICLLSALTSSRISHIRESAISRVRPFFLMQSFLCYDFNLCQCLSQSLIHRHI